jgi:diguanylate cyclase (GGDEF)-like protein
MNILIVDDEVATRELVAEILGGEGHEITLAEDGEDALEKFKRSWHEIVFSDIRMPKMNGIELLAAIKGINADTQFVIMTSHASIDNSIQALKMGAFDYIFKPFEDLDVITDAMNRAMANLSGIRQQRALYETLSRQNEELDTLNIKILDLAIRDSLTGLFDRGYAQERLDKEFDRATKHARELTVLFMDLDHFKLFNDTHGHQAGDEILQILAGIMTEAVRESDTLARWGGEEFIVICPETNREDACMLAERIRKSVAGHPFPNAAQQPLGIVSLSIGLASRSNGTESSEKLLGLADDALYYAKDNGRNRAVFNSGPKQVNNVETLPTADGETY